VAKRKAPTAEYTTVDVSFGYYVQVSPTVWVNPSDIQGIEFENWDPTPKPELIVLLAPKVKAKCIMHMGFGLSLQFELAEGETPDTVVAKLGGTRGGL
jgi:hypothetical protein